MVEDRAAKERRSKKRKVADIEVHRDSASASPVKQYLRVLAQESGDVQHLATEEIAILAEARRARRALQSWLPDDSQGTLLLGEGDFSFTLSFALRGVRGPVVATSYEEERQLQDKYRLFSSNAKALRRLGVLLLFGVDAMDIAGSAPTLVGRRFSRIIFNFPHSGVPNYQKPSIPSNQQLLRGVFLSVAPFLARVGGSELRITLRKDPVYHAWRILDQAEAAFQQLVGQGAKKALCPIGSGDFPYHLFFGYRHAATAEDRAVDNPESVTWVFELRKTWQVPPELVAEAAGAVEWSQGVYSCKLCGIDFRSPKQLEMHEGGRRHQEAAAAAGVKSRGRGRGHR